MVDLLFVVVVNLSLNLQENYKSTFLKLKWDIGWKFFFKELFTCKTSEESSNGGHHEHVGHFLNKLSSVGGVGG